MPFQLPLLPCGRSGAAHGHLSIGRIWYQVTGAALSGSDMSVISAVLVQGLATPRLQRHVCAGASSNSTALPSMAGKRGGNEQAEALHQYLIATTIRHDEHLHALQTASLSHCRARMLSPPDTVAILQFLLQIINAKVVLDVGTFTGYTALGMALGLPADGIVYTLDISNNCVELGRPFWQRAGVSHQIEFLHASASDSLHKLLKDLGPDSVDLGFVDADKANYDTYYEQLLILIRPGGIIVIDNVFWGGAVLDHTDQSASTQAIRDLNRKIHEDPRVKIAMLKNSDGILLATKI